MDSSRYRIALISGFWGLGGLSIGGVHVMNYSRHLSDSKTANFALELISEHRTATVQLAIEVFWILCTHLWAGVVLAALCFGATGILAARPLLRTTCVFFSGAWLLLYVNTELFTRSTWSYLVQPIFDAPASVAMTALATGFIIYRVVCCVLDTARSFSWPTFTRAALACSLLVFAFSVYRGLDSDRSYETRAAGNHPNLIVIGVDSVRRDVALGETRSSPLALSQAEMNALTPTLHAIRESSEVYTNVVTPLARTFPSWTSILTELNPAEHGVRTNLAQQAHLAHLPAWPARAARTGFNTFFATDESRFSNVLPHSGFEHIEYPLPGLTDFMVGQASDLPLINLAIQIPGAQRLFPSLVGNRAVAHSYRPDRFIRRMDHAFAGQYQEDKPQFLAFHLCTAHWPYYTALADQTAPLERYGRSLQVLDSQLGELLAWLEQTGLYNQNSTLAILSDHGETLPVDSMHVRARATDALLERYPAKMGGHGAELVAGADWKTFLFVRRPHTQTRVDFDGLYTLADIAKLVEGQAPTPRRFAMIETGFNPAGFNPTDPDTGAAIRIAQETYDLTEDGRFEMRSVVSALAENVKQAGVTNGTQLLATLPIFGDSRDADPALAYVDYDKDIYDLLEPSRLSRYPAAEELNNAACKLVDLAHARTQYACSE